MILVEDQCATGCSCCGWQATEHKLNDLALQAVERKAMDWAGLAIVMRDETNDAPYVSAEASLTQDLAEHANGLASDIEGPIFDALDSYINESKLTDALKSAQALWANKAWSKNLNTSVRNTLSRTALVGAQDIPFGPLLSDTDKLRIVNGMSESAKYYTNGYFNNQVMPAVVDAAHAAVLNGLAHDGAELKAIRALLDARLHSVPYWNLVANGAASRAYHYGYIKTGVAKGLQTVEYHAVIDDRTSRQCFLLNGTQWKASDISLLADRIAGAKGDAIKTVAPWVTAAQVRGKTPAELLAMGVVIPPIHGRCRSQLIFV